MRILSKFEVNISRPIANGVAAVSGGEFILYSVYSFEGKGEGSTVKDIGADETLQHAVSQGANVIVNVTQGNNGQALKKAVHILIQGLSLEEMVKVIHIVPPNLDLEETLNGTLKGFNYSLPLVFPDLNKRWLTEKDRVRLAQDFLRNEQHFNIRQVVDVTHYVPNEYIKQARQILLDTIEGRHLDFLAIPLGTGRVYTAFYRALQQLQQEECAINTKLVGIVPENEHPIYHNFVSKGNKIRRYNPASIADKLSCPYTDLLPELKKAQEDGHPIIQVNNEEIERAMQDYNRTRTISLHTGAIIPMLEPSGLVGFALMNPAFTRGISKTTRIGIFTTGMGIYMPIKYVPDSFLFEINDRGEVVSVK